MSSQHKGIVTQIIGPVLDIRFAEGELPELRNAITIQHGEQVITAEVAQHIGDNVVRCIAMNSTMAWCAAWKLLIPVRPSACRWARNASDAFSIFGRAH